MGLACRSEAQADRFFINVLGLAKSEPRILPRQIVEGIFGLAADLTMINYTGRGIRFEVFIDPNRQRSNDLIVHACLTVEDRDAFLSRCEDHDLNVIRVPKGETLLTFVRDYDGNLYEIKSA